MKTALTIAGSDSGGGAGIQADLKTFSSLGIYGMSAITAVTAQNTQAVTAVEDLSAEIVTEQIRAVFDDIWVDAVKIGMVSQESTIKAIAQMMQRYQPKHIVVDPVMISKSGFSLLKPEAKASLIKELLPVASLITPNLKEAEELIGRKINTIKEMEEAAANISKMGCPAVLVKGGHLSGEPVDILFVDGKFVRFSGKRIKTKHTHGTGCTLSSAITSHLAKGQDLQTAIALGKAYIEAALAQSLAIGKGTGPTHHFHEWFPQK